MPLIDPNLMSGFRDYLPKDMIPRQKMFDIIRACFELFGFVPLDTPGLEREEVLTGGDPDFTMQIYRARLRSLESGLALRFDLTVPLARVIALYPGEIEKPFKRYQVGKVWRGEKAQAGRFHEFVQFDADIVGSSSMMADAEIVALMYETLSALGVPNFLVRVNNRKVLNGLAEFAGFPQAKTPDILRKLDKLGKQNWENISEELLAPGVELGAKAVDAIKQFVNLSAGSKEELLQAVRKLMASSPVALEGVDELQTIVGHVRALGIPEDKWAIDLSIARGLGYYTGPVFEATLLDLSSIGSVFSGGRYDNLVSRFGQVTVPATGASIGVDRLFAALEQLELVKGQKTVTKVIVLNFDETCATACETVATVLRRGGIPTEVYVGREISLKAQLAHAVRQDVPVVLLIGSREQERRVVMVKDMLARTQAEVPQTEVLTKVRQILRMEP